MAWYLVAALSAGLSTVLLRPVLVHLAVPGLSNVVATLPDGWRLLMAVVLFDGVFFAVHVGLHRSDTLWNVHKVNHSSHHLDVLATTRTHAFEHLVRTSQPNSCSSPSGSRPRPSPPPSWSSPASVP